MMHYYAELSFKEGLSIEEQTKMIEKIANNKGTLPPDLFQHFDIKNVKQTPECGRISRETIQLNESLLSKNMSSEQVAQVFCDNMQPQDADKELIVIDPYFFSARKNTLVDICIRLDKILDEYATISTIKIVTDSRHIKECQRTITDILKQNNRKVLCAYSEDFHDRFWLIDGVRGVVVGTSLNGIGKKFSLMTPLEQDDVSDIMNEVNKLNFQLQ